MDDTILSRPAPRTVGEYKAAIAELMAEMDRLNEKMRCDQAEIDRLRAETDVLRAETRAILAQLGAPL